MKIFVNIFCSFLLIISFNQNLLAWDTGNTWQNIDSPNFLHSSNHDIVMAGDYLQFAPLVAALGFILYYEDTNIHKHGFKNIKNNFTLENYKNDGLFQLGTTVGASIATMSLTKLAVGRDRPEAVSHGEHTPRTNSSFPSGHATMAFAPSFFVAQRYGWLKSIPLMIISSYVGYSRIASEAHYITDVVGSVLVSYIYSHFLVSKYKINGITVSLAPGPSIANYGVGVQFNWN